MDELKEKKITTSLCLSRFVLIDAPKYVIDALKQYSRELEKAEPGAVPFSEGIEVGDSCTMSLVNVREKEKN